MSEALEQRAVVAYCDLKKIPVSNIPNGDCRKQCLPCRETMRQAAQTLGATSPKRLVQCHLCNAKKPRPSRRGFRCLLKSCKGDSYPGLGARVSGRLFSWPFQSAF